MRIDIFSDVVCPFCYIGKRHLEAALDQAGLADQADIHWHAFELDPNAEKFPQQGLVEMIASKYGLDQAQAEQSQEAIAQRARQVGLEFNWRHAQHGNTLDAHRLIHLAGTHGKAPAAEEALMRAYFTEGKNPADHRTLRDVAQEIGLDAAEVDQLLSGQRFEAEVREDEAAAHRIGVQGVPFFIFNGKFALSGAQPIDVFVQALQQALEEEEQEGSAPEQDSPSPAGTATGEACGPEGCPVN